MPIIPLVLVNGASGIGTGWSTEIPQHNPEDIVENLIRMLNGEDPKPMDPWFFGFDGTVETSGNRIFSFCDVISFHSFFILSTTLILLFFYSFILLFFYSFNNTYSTLFLFSQQPNQTDHKKYKITGVYKKTGENTLVSCRHLRTINLNCLKINK